MDDTCKIIRLKEMTEVILISTFKFALYSDCFLPSSMLFLRGLLVNYVIDDIFEVTCLTSTK